MKLILKWFRLFFVSTVMMCLSVAVMNIQYRLGLCGAICTGLFMIIDMILTVVDELRK